MQLYGPEYTGTPFASVWPISRGLFAPRCILNVSEVIGSGVLCRSDGQRALFLLRRRPETLATVRRSMDRAPTMVYAMSVRHRTRRTASDGQKRRQFPLFCENVHTADSA